MLVRNPAPNQRRAREKGAHGGAAAATSTMPELAKEQRLANCSSLSKSNPHPWSLSSGSRRARPRADSAVDRGADAPANKSTKSLQAGSGEVATNPQTEGTKKPAASEMH